MENVHHSARWRRRFLLRGGARTAARLLEDLGLIHVRGVTQAPFAGKSRCERWIENVRTNRRAVHCSGRIQRITQRQTDSSLVFGKLELLCFLRSHDEGRYGDFRRLGVDGLTRLYGMANRQ